MRWYMPYLITKRLRGKCVCLQKRQSARVAVSRVLSVCLCSLLWMCSRAADGYLLERGSSIDLAGVNNWLGLQAVMFGLIAEHWWSRAVIFLHIPLWSFCSLLSLSLHLLIRTLYDHSPSFNLDCNPCPEAVCYKLSALHSLFCCRERDRYNLRKRGKKKQQENEENTEWGHLEGSDVTQACNGLPYFSLTVDYISTE